MSFTFFKNITKVVHYLVFSILVYFKNQVYKFITISYREVNC